MPSESVLGANAVTKLAPAHMNAANLPTTSLAQSDRVRLTNPKLAAHVLFNMRVHINPGQLLVGLSGVSLIRHSRQLFFVDLIGD